MLAEATLKIAVPLYVKAYVYNRFVESIEWLDAKQFRFFVNQYSLRVSENNDDRYINDKGMQLDKLETIDGIRKCLVKWPVKATTIIKDPMLMRAAYLEFQTYAVRHRLSIQEAKYILIDEYPDTNCGEVYDESCHNLIRKNKGCLELTYQQFEKLKADRPRPTRNYA
jgi:hypothetical protein